MKCTPFFDAHEFQRTIGREEHVRGQGAGQKAQHDMPPVQQQPEADNPIICRETFFDEGHLQLLPQSLSCKFLNSHPQSSKENPSLFEFFHLFARGLGLNEMKSGQ